MSSYFAATSSLICMIFVMRINHMLVGIHNKRRGLTCMQNSGVFMELSVDTVAYIVLIQGPLDW